MMLKRNYRKFQSSAIDHVNITPVLDVMLTILVAFILIAPHLKHGIITDVPQAYGESLKAADSVTVSVKDDGTFFFENDQVTFSELEREIQRLARAESHPTIYLEASKEARYEDFVKVLGLLKETGIENIDLATRPRSG